MADKNVTLLFNIYETNNKEVYEGQILNEFQRMYLHNLRADIAEKLLRLPFTPENVIDFAQQEAYLTGRLELLDELLAPIEPLTPTEGD